jgi:hypothetical protein
MKNTTTLVMALYFVVALTSCDRGTSRSDVPSLVALSGQRVRIDFKRPIPEQPYEDLTAKGETRVARRYYIEGILISADNAGILIQEDKLKRWMNLSEVAMITPIDK